MVWFPGKIIICIFKRDRGLERYVGNYLLLRPGRMRCLSMTWADGHIQRSAACFQLLLFCLCHVKHTWQDFIFGIMYSMWLENQNSIHLSWKCVCPVMGCLMLQFWIWDVCFWGLYKLYLFTKCCSLFLQFNSLWFVQIRYIKASSHVRVYWTCFVQIEIVTEN